MEMRVATLPLSVPSFLPIHGKQREKERKKEQIKKRRKCSGWGVLPSHPCFSFLFFSLAPSFSLIYFLHKEVVGEREWPLLSLSVSFFLSLQEKQREKEKEAIEAICPQRIYIVLLCANGIPILSVVPQRGYLSFHTRISFRICLSKRGCLY